MLLLLHFDWFAFAVTIALLLVQLLVHLITENVLLRLLPSLLTLLISAGLFAVGAWVSGDVAYLCLLVIILLPDAVCSLLLGWGLSKVLVTLRIRLRRQTEE